MNKTVVCTFSNKDQAEKAVGEMRERGFERDISVLTKDDKGKQGNSMSMGSGDSVSDGATTGGTVGAVAGLAVGVGALAIPGLGPLVAAGPITALLSGAATGGLAGGLMDYGIPEAEGKEYEAKIRQGHTLVAVKSDENHVNQAAEIMRKHQGEGVKIHG